VSGGRSFALLASGSILLLCEPVRNPAGAPRVACGRRAANWDNRPLCAGRRAGIHSWH